MQLSKKQAEFWNEPYHRWNIKCGATRTGKTYLDFFIIPREILARRGKPGLNVILGNTRGTIQRNVIAPMQDIYTTSLVSDIHADNTIDLFGEKAYCLGADNIRHADRIRGTSIKYCYGDELVTWNKDVFEMLKSRLDQPYSRFDGTCNPSFPTHWAKKFIDESGADIFYQQYSIFDNPFLDPKVKEALIKEHHGVFYQRNILGQWAIADGLIYDFFARNENDFYITPEEVPIHDIGYINVGQDFGGRKSKHTLCATAISRNYKTLYVLASKEIEGTGTSVDTVIEVLDKFCHEIQKRYRNIDFVFADSAEQTIINTEDSKTQWTFKNSVKHDIIDRIRAEDILFSNMRIKIVKAHNDSLTAALREAYWDPDKDEDKRCDKPGITNICPLDAFEYSWEYWIDLLTS